MPCNDIQLSKTSTQVQSSTALAESIFVLKLLVLRWVSISWISLAKPSPFQVKAAVRAVRGQLLFDHVWSRKSMEESQGHEIDLQASFFAGVQPLLHEKYWHRMEEHCIRCVSAGSSFRVVHCFGLCWTASMKHWQISVSRLTSDLSGRASLLKGYMSNLFKIASRPHILF